MKLDAAPEMAFQKEIEGVQYFQLPFQHVQGMGPFKMVTDFMLTAAKKAGELLPDEYFLNIRDSNGLNYSVGPMNQEDFGAKWRLYINKLSGQ